jgi:hypothetical protein
MSDGMMGGGMGIWMLLGTGFWILLIAGIVLLVVWRRWALQMHRV